MLFKQENSQKGRLNNANANEIEGQTGERVTHFPPILHQSAELFIKLFGYTSLQGIYIETVFRVYKSQYKSHLHYSLCWWEVSHFNAFTIRWYHFGKC